MNFSQYPLSTEILEALATLGFNEATEVQQQTIPLILDKKDLVVQSQTGSGKTAAYAIPICEALNWEENKPQALVLTPTRELAVQVKEDFIHIGRLKRINATEVYGKQSFYYQKQKLKSKTHVVVGTPGRLLDHIQKGTINLSQINYLVIDEADEMLNMGFIEQVEAILQTLPREKVTLLFSATMPEEVKKLAEKHLQQPKNVRINSKNLTTTQIEHVQMIVRESEKMSLLRSVTIIENPDTAIIFCRTKDRVDELFKKMTELDYDCDRIHGGMVQEDRLEVMQDFKRGEFRYLIATDVAARGIDIDNVTHVINYDLPLEKEAYVHRTGRTGRAGQKGKAITFVTPNEDRFLAELEEYLGFAITQQDLPTASELEAARPAFEEKHEYAPETKKLKSEELNRSITKLYFNGGKKKKLRAVDFVGTIAKLDGIAATDIGIITILDNATYVEILNGKGPAVLNEMRHTTVKGKQLKVHIARD